ECLRWTGRGEERWGVTAYVQVRVFFDGLAVAPQLQRPCVSVLHGGFLDVFEADFPALFPDARAFAEPVLRAR
ncbi:MAG TPA: hypothetical protein PLM62_19340, partial [Zoogloea sp.]|nr:hypothetical protein [Zoogloea sp.]